MPFDLLPTDGQHDADAAAAAATVGDAAAALGAGVGAADAVRGQLAAWVGRAARQPHLLRLRQRRHATVWSGREYAHCTAYAASSSSPHSQCSATPYDFSSLATIRLSCLPRCCAPAAFPAWLTECAAATVFFNYIFLESERDPENDPVVVWYNGGPGAASMFGLFVEIGPYLLNKDSVDPLDPEGMETVLANPYSWTKVANVVAVNNPPPIGFSYCTGGDPANTGPSGDGYSCGAWNDGLTAAANRAFLASLFLNDFPEVSPQLTAAHIDMIASMLCPAMRVTCFFPRKPPKFASDCLAVCGCARR